MRYEFQSVNYCEMCGSPSHKMLGMRLNRSQGLSPARVSGIAVSVKRCDQCGLIFSDPRPIPDQLSDHYGVTPDEYWGGVPDWSPDYFSDEIARAKRLLSFREGMTALDVGSGYGHGLRSLLHAGFDAWGVEPTKPFHDKALEVVDKSRLKLATAEEADFPAATFDLIVMRDVLEHLQSPRAALLRALRWLKPNGILFVHVPSSDWLIARLVNGYYRLRGTNYVTNLSPMHAPFHLYEFTPRSFSGFEIAEYFYSVCDVTHVPNIVRPLLATIMERTSTGMMMGVYLRAAPIGGR